MDALVNKRIKKVLKGDQNAFAEIVDLYQHKLFQYVIECLEIGMKRKILRKKHLFVHLLTYIRLIKKENFQLGCTELQPIYVSIV